MYAIFPEPQPMPEKRVWGFWATVGLGAAVIAIFFIFQTLVAAIAGIIVAFPEISAADPSEYDTFMQTIMDAINARLGFLQSLATIISGVAGVGMIMIFIRARKRAGIIEYLGLYQISGKQVLASLAIILALIGVMTLLEIFMGVEAGDTINNTLWDTSIWPPLFGIAVIIFAPLFEEFLFRGFLFEGFLQSRAGPAGAIILTSIVFAILHIQYNAFGMFYIFVLGIVMGLMRWKTRTLWSPLIMHATMNLVATVTLWLS